jgi:hypothetical protein
MVVYGDTVNDTPRLIFQYLESSTLLHDCTCFINVVLAVFLDSVKLLYFEMKAKLYAVM